MDTCPCPDLEEIKGFSCAAGVVAGAMLVAFAILVSITGYSQALTIVLVSCLGTYLAFLMLMVPWLVLAKAYTRTKIHTIVRVFIIVTAYASSLVALFVRSLLQSASILPLLIAIGAVFTYAATKNFDTALAVSVTIAYSAFLSVDALSLQGPPRANTVTQGLFLKPFEVLPTLTRIFADHEEIQKLRKMAVAGDSTDA